MKKFFGVLAIVLALSITLLPLRAHAEERIGVKFNNGNLHVKPGPVSAPWQQLTSGVSIGDFDLVGDYISLINTGGGNPNTMMLKQPSWNSPWDYVHLNTAAKVSMTKTSNGQYRIVVLKTDGSVYMKDGAWNSDWIGTIEVSGVSKVVLGGDNVGLIMNNGDFKAKRLTPGQFTNPNSVAWQLVALDVNEAAMTDTRIAIRRVGAIFAKEGGISAPWFNNNNVIISYATNVRLAGDKLCATKDPAWQGNALYVECQQGSFGSQSVATYGEPTDFQISQTRFLALKPNGTVEVMEGSLSRNSGWRTIATQANGIALNPIP